MTKRTNTLCILVAGLLVSLAAEAAAPYAYNDSSLQRGITGKDYRKYKFGPTEIDGEQVTTWGVGTCGTSLSCVERGDGVSHQTVITFTALSITVTDATTAGAHGSKLSYTFPPGPIQILGASANLTTLAGAGGIADTAALVGSLGSATVGTDNATLTSTEADLIASYAGTLTDGAGVITKYGSLVAAAFDGTSTAAKAYLNVAVPDAGMSDGVNDTLAVTGTVTITWINLGDF